MREYPMNTATEVARKQTALGGFDATPTMTERLHREREHLEHRLAQVKEAIAALESSPEVARAVDAISKVGGIGY